MRLPQDAAEVLLQAQAFQLVAPGDIPASLLQAWQWVDMGAAGQARPLLHQILKEDPQNADALRLLQDLNARDPLKLAASFEESQAWLQTYPHQSQAVVRSVEARVEFLQGELRHQEEITSVEFQLAWLPWALVLCFAFVFTRFYFKSKT
jgi:thioredoxin-like negative regulator of GroEL